MTSELYVAAELPDKATTFRKSNPPIKLKLTVIVFAVISLITYSMFQAMTTMTRWSFGEEDCFLVYSILPRTL